MTETETYQRARRQARRALTFRLRRQEQRILAHARGRRPSRDDLIHLGAIRAELLARRTGRRRARPFHGLWTS